MGAERGEEREAAEREIERGKRGQRERERRAQ